MRVPADLPWEEADLAIQHPRSQWAAWGVTSPTAARSRRTVCRRRCSCRWAGSGRPSSPIRISTSITQWNQSLVYATTAAYFATRLAGAPKVQRGTAKALSRDEVKDVQQRLAGARHDVGGIDGTIGAQTRAAVKILQQQFGLPADSYPTSEFLAALRKS